jgi:hypothetical protein
MPAHEARKQILTRMWEDEQIRLDALCVALSDAERPLGRSEVVNRLVADAYAALPPKAREDATNAARRRARPHRRPVAVAD